MAIMTVTTKITRQYLERKTKSDLAQMYLDLLDEDIKLEKLATQVVVWEREYRQMNNLGAKAPDCFQALARILRGVDAEGRLYSDTSGQAEAGKPRESSI